MITADRAVDVAPQLQLAEAHVPGVIEQQTTDQRRPAAEEQLDGLRRLDRTDDARQHAQHATLGATRDQPGRRWLGIEAAIARSTLGCEDRRLPLEAEDAAVSVGLSEDHARIVDEIPRREVVGAVEDDVIVAEDLERVLRGQRGLVAVDLERRIERREAVLRRGELRAADVTRAVQDLTLQVAGVDVVEIDDAERTQAGSGEIERRRGSEPARADAEHAAGLQLALPFDADLRQDQVPAVALDLVVGQRRQLRRRRFGRSAHRRAAGNGRDDADHVTVLERGALLLQVPDVIVVDVDVDEVAQLAIVAVQMSLQLAMLRRQRGQDVADGRTVRLDSILLSGVRTQGRRDQDSVGHINSPCSNADRSSFRCQQVMSPGTAAFTEMIT